MTITHANHTIREFTNVNGTVKFEVVKIGETKPRGQTMTMDRAIKLAEQSA